MSARCRSEPPRCQRCPIFFCAYGLCLWLPSPTLIWCAFATRQTAGAAALHAARPPRKAAEHMFQLAIYFLQLARAFRLSRFSPPRHFATPPRRIFRRHDAGADAAVIYARRGDAAPPPSRAF